MLTDHGCRARRERLLATHSECDWIIIADPIHLMYLANFYLDPFVFRSVNAAGILLLSKHGRSVLVADSMVRAQSLRSFVDEVQHPTWYDGEHSAPIRSVHLIDNAMKVLDSESIGTLGIEVGRTPAGIVAGLLAKRPEITLVSVDAELARLKRAKDPDEMVLIKQSIKAIEAGFATARERIHAGMSELDAYHVVERASRESLGLLMPIYGDFASGPRSEAGGGPPTDRIIREGDLFLLDYSVVVYGYRGDFANSWIVDGKASDQVRYLHDASREALLQAERTLFPGQSAREVDRAVRQSFATKGIEAQFTSHSGHGLGLGHPDPPYFVPKSNDTLVEGDVVAIEPSQKLVGVGCIRVEHNYLITAEGYQRLSGHALTVD
ncbi:Xaa-Pro peptidase family protein [bacterium]|nr:Xaa-Pro peptidase family protein [bacterium]